MKRSLVLYAIPAVLTGAAFLISPGHTEPLRRELQNCVAGVGPGQRQRCDEEASQQVNALSQTTSLADGWRLVRTKNPSSSAEAMSVMHVAQTTKSDLALAGLSLRCSGNGIEVVLIMLEPLPRGSHPSVTVTMGSSKVQFEASATQRGEALLLPPSAASLAAGEWQNAGELGIEIATEPAPIKGTMPIRGLSGALRALSPYCAGK
jgi:hypothetical protein